MAQPNILWLRQDLRLADQPALLAAVEAGPVVPVYVLDDETPGDWRIGGAQRWWLHHSLASLDEDLRAHGSRLILRRGRAAEIVLQVADEVGANAIHAIRHSEPWWVRAEQAFGERLQLHDGNHLAPLQSLTTGSGAQFRIFSAFYKALSQVMPPDNPLPAPKTIPAPENWPASDALSDWRLLPDRPDWAKAFGDDWQPGEAGAEQRLATFADKLARYDHDRNLPSDDGSSRLSPHLHHGEISPRRLWHALDRPGEGAASYRRELAWRDFTDNLTLTLDRYAEQHGRPAFDRLEWRDAPDDLKAWQRGRTGYPIVDAGMRQMWSSGWMHNRVRMIVASFLTKHLLIDWRAGERWFWDCLIDADYGNNSVNWQWVAGTGVDANMFGRIMAPLMQSEKFDAGGYIRRWVPELADVPDAAIHDPEEAGCRPDAYPRKIIGHREGRERALAAQRKMR